MPLPDVPAAASPPVMPLLMAAVLQDHLLTATNDLDRLQRLLNDAGEALMGHFYGANHSLNGLLHQAAVLPHVDTTALHTAMQNLAGAVTALQFQDMATQLIDHTHQRLRACADQLAREAMGNDAEGECVVSEAPLRPNPVTQDEMDAGSVELF
ncbi:MAG: hypothetical protein AB9M60_05100 [Leptothrix sp. (in: b-proteobacteria)]